jgi:HlyD family secretion protein
VEIHTTVAGRLQKLYPTSSFGAVVKKGDPLAELDPKRFQAEVSIAKANMEWAVWDVRAAEAKVVLAERELEQAKKLQQKTADASVVAIREAALEVAKTNVAVEEAKVAQRRAILSRAEIDVNACSIRSPIDGVVIDVRTNAGQTVAGSPTEPSLFLVASDLKHLHIWASVPEEEIARIAKGNLATFSVSAFPDEKFKAVVKQIRLNAAVQKDKVSYTVVLDVDNSDGRLLPYMSAIVTIDTGGRR